MSALTPELLRELVAEARLAPSVHNIQPTRWRLCPDGRLDLSTTQAYAHLSPTRPAMTSACRMAPRWKA
jgi:nitroreductase